MAHEAISTVGSRSSSPAGVTDDPELRRLFEEIGRKAEGKAVRDF